MSEILEYAIIIFMAGLLVILFRWSENGHYQANLATGALLIDTRSGDAWSPGSNKMFVSPVNK